MKNLLNFKNNKRAEKLFSLWWFLILAVVGGGIIVGVLIFFSADVDIRGLESLVLSDKLTNCLIRQGYVIDEFFEEEFDIFKTCGISKEILNSENFYLRITLLKEEGGDIIKEIYAGARSFEEDCKIGERLIARHFPKCTENKEKVMYYGIEDNSKEKITSLYILTASNQKGRKTP